MEDGNWCKLSSKFFTTEKIKKIKVTIDQRFKIKSIKYRTEIHFDDITHFKVRLREDPEIFIPLPAFKPQF